MFRWLISLFMAPSVEGAHKQLTKAVDNLQFTVDFHNKKVEKKKVKVAKLENACVTHAATAEQASRVAAKLSDLLS